MIVIEKELLRDFDDSGLSGFIELDDSDADKHSHASSKSTDGSRIFMHNTKYILWFKLLFHSTIFFNY